MGTRVSASATSLLRQHNPSLIQEILRGILTLFFSKIQFTVADESIFPDFRKEQVLKTTDGGSCTLK